MRQASPDATAPLPDNADLLNAVNAGVLVLNPADGEIITANDRARAMLCGGCALPSLEALFPRGEFHLADLLEGVSGVECRITGAQGQAVPVLLASRLVEREDGGRLILTVTDLSLLRRAEARYQSFFENVIEGVFQSTKSGRYLMVNPGLASILGFDSPEELIAHFKDLRSQLYVDPADRDTLFRVLRETGQIKGFETQFICKDGSTRWISLTAREVRDPTSGELLYIEGLNIDITARKEAERALKESEEKFRHTFDQSPIGASMVSLDNTFLRANEAFCRITGYTEAELKSITFAAITHPDEREESLRQYDRVKRGEIDSWEQDKRYIAKDGREVWVHLSAGIVRDSSGRPLYLLPMVQDINHRVETERAMQAIHAEKERLRSGLEAVFRSIPDAIITVDTDMRIIQTNRALSEVCCIGPELRQDKDLSCVSGSCKRACFTVLRTTLETRKPVFEHRVECQTHAPGKVVIINSSPLLDRDNNFAGAVLVIRDITRLADLEKRLTDLHSHRGIVGKSKVMQDIYAVLDQLSDVESTVLITGESGTGKELVAEALHYGGSRCKGPLIKVNCSALSESLLESELFGHMRGAFTGAIRDKIGRFEAAEGGTIFLDEIGDISPRIQLNLLRVLERKEFERVGDSRTRKANVRVLAATNVDLLEKIRQGLFREDLYYRLKVMVIQLPPLRERTEDIPLLMTHFISHFQASFGKRITKCSDEVMRLFMTYPWPGNVRELKYSLEHSCILCPGGEITSAHLPADLLRFSQGQALPRLLSALPAQRRGVQSGLTREDITRALAHAGDNRAKAARLLGVDRRTLYRNMAKHQIS
ncbi:MAG TPA: sigma 54-interacting transcriptional regulator [Humidesulfovibrio sp.]|uniref:sigma 54-interacting transcriptional regulator n=1 Tax=Humidesulfovibrio sp. TaxID=2910988 RepID=UPI002BB8E708|nr:sigma 54-interacting transcriptional regulator [Humidesulfovibrio sp.]HWR05111.1 sigma 54-interacting transcriptional regulator [Humidesulfovibrio sp.]